MKRLSLLDALFLYMETPETPMHVASVTIFNRRRRRTTASSASASMSRPDDLMPSYRRRLASTPLGIDHPVWVIEDKLDLDYHIRHQALPKPGGMEELRALIGRLHAVPLDRSRPLWEYHFIEGLEDGGFAVYIKVHHSTMDGARGDGDAWRHLRFCARRGAGKPAAETRPSRRRAVRFHRADEHRRRRFHPPGLAGGEVATGGRQGADKGRAEFRPRRALSL